MDKLIDKIFSILPIDYWRNTDGEEELEYRKQIKELIQEHIRTVFKINPDFLSNLQLLSENLEIGNEIGTKAIQKALNEHLSSLLYRIDVDMKKKQFALIDIVDGRNEPGD